MKSVFSIFVGTAIFSFNVSYVYAEKFFSRDTTPLINLKYDSDTLQDIVVSGNFRTIKKSNSLIPIESYSAAFLKRQIEPDIWSSLSRVNGVLPQMSCQVCFTTSFRLNGLDGPYTLVLIDGMPIVSALSSVYGLTGLPQSLIKRVEVIKGPASALYGSEAVAGVINLITKDPGSKTELSLLHTSSSYLESTTDIGLNFKTGKASSLVGVQHFMMDKRWDINHDGFTDIPLQHRISLFNKWNFERKSGLPVSFAWRYFYEDRWGGEMNWQKKSRGGEDVYGESIFTNRLEGIGRYGLKIAGRLIEADFSYNYHRQDSYYGNISYDASQHTTFAQLRTEWVKKKIRVLSGIPFRMIHYDDNTPATSSIITGKTIPSISISSGAFSQLEWEAGKKMSFLGGMRLEFHNVHRPVISHRIGFKYTPAENHVFRYSSGNGFRLVNLFTEEHAALTGARTVVVTESIRPELSTNYHLNYTNYQKVGRGLLSIDAGLFYTSFSNRILPDFDTNPNLIIYSNLDGIAVSRGLSFQIDYNKGDLFRCNAGFTWMDVFQRENEKGKTDIIYTPPFSATYGIGCTLFKKRAELDITGTTTSPMRMPVLPGDFRPEYSPWYTLLHLQFSLQVNQNLGLKAGVRNLFNFLPVHPIMRPFDPFDRAADNLVTNPNGYTFDASYSYAPLMSRRVLLSVSYRFCKK